MSKTEIRFRNNPRVLDCRVFYQSTGVGGSTKTVAIAITHHICLKVAMFLELVIAR